MPSVETSDDRYGYEFWKSATWAVPYSLAAGITIVACVAAVASREYYSTPSLRIIGPVVAVIMLCVASPLWRASSSAKRGAGVSVAMKKYPLVARSRSPLVAG